MSSQESSPPLVVVAHPCNARYRRKMAQPVETEPDATKASERRDEARPVRRKRAANG